MVMENKKNEIDLQTVVDRFRQAEENLHRTTDEVKKIILNSDIAKESSDSIKNSSQKLTQFAESLNKSISEISSAVVELRGSLQAAAKFIEKTDLSEINKTVKCLQIIRVTLSPHPMNIPQTLNIHQAIFWHNFFVFKFYLNTILAVMYDVRCISSRNSWNVKLDGI